MTKTPAALLGITLFVGASYADNIPPKMIPNPDCIKETRVQVFQSLDFEKDALGFLCPNNTSWDDCNDFTQVVWLVNPRANQRYYDYQKVELPAGKCFVEAEPITYENRNGVERTVRAIRIEDAQLLNHGYIQYKYDMASEKIQKKVAKIQNQLIKTWNKIDKLKHSTPKNITESQAESYIKKAQKISIKMDKLVEERNRLLGI